MKTDFLKKYAIYLIVVFLAGIGLFSCQKDKFIVFPDPSTLPKGLTGSWVEATTGTDTIIFHSEADSGIFYLSRGFGMINGYWLPQIGSTWYLYKISADSISLENGLSDSFDRATYLFRFDEPNLTITVGKFSKYIDTEKSVLTFRKIK